MICKVCWGKGWILNGTYERIECPACHGTKETDPTNEDWFCSLSTEEKATFLAVNKLNFDYQMWLEWLKEKHNG